MEAFLARRAGLRAPFFCLVHGAAADESRYLQEFVASQGSSFQAVAINLALTGSNSYSSSLILADGEGTHTSVTPSMRQHCGNSTATSVTAAIIESMHGIKTAHGLKASGPHSVGVVVGRLGTSLARESISQVCRRLTTLHDIACDNAITVGPVVAQMSVAESGSRAFASISSLASLVVRVDRHPRLGEGGLQMGAALVTEVGSSGKLRSYIQQYSVASGGRVNLMAFEPATALTGNALMPVPPAPLPQGVGGRKTAPHTVVEPVSGMPDTAPSMPKAAFANAAAPAGEVAIQRPTRSPTSAASSHGHGTASSGKDRGAAPSIFVEQGDADSDDDGGGRDDYGYGPPDAEEDLDDDLDL